MLRLRTGPESVDHPYSRYEGLQPSQNKIPRKEGIIMKKELLEKIDRLQGELNTISHNQRFYKNQSTYEFLRDTTQEEIDATKREIFYLDNPHLNDLEW